MMHTESTWPFYRRPLLFSAVLFVLLAPPAYGLGHLAQWCRDGYGAARHWCRLPMCGCPDDYCAKRLPCIKGPGSGCCPGPFCGKPLPCVVRRCAKVRDDYCRKPLPK